jgi:hypothetical protein
MKTRYRVAKWMFIAAAAVVAILASLAALHLDSREGSSVAYRDPLKPDASAPDETGEVASKSGAAMDLKRAEQGAIEKFGALPKPAPADELARAGEFAGGIQSLDDFYRIRELRKTKGSAAAVAAMKNLRPTAAP